MEYNITYTKYYNENYSKFEKIIKAKFVKSKLKKRNFGIVLNEIQNYLSVEYIKKIHLLKDNQLEDLYKEFKARYTHYEEDHIEEIFKNKIEKTFNKLVVDYNYTLNDLIREIALLEVANEIGRLLQIHFSLFDLFYKANEFEEFEIRVYGNSALKDVPIYKKLHKKVYPEYYVHESNSSSNSNPFELKKTNLESSFNGINASNNLSIDEKSFLFYIMCEALNETNKSNGQYNLPFTELLRLSTIIDFKDEKSFTKNYGDSTHYKILSKGLNYIPVNERRIFLYNLIANLKNLQLKETTKYIKKILNTHLNQLSSKKK